MGFGKTGHVMLFEHFSGFVNENGYILKKIGGAIGTAFYSTLVGIFIQSRSRLRKIREYMDNEKVELELGDFGYYDLTELDGVSQDDMTDWFSKFTFGNNKTVGKGEVLLSILFDNVFKTSVGRTDGGETGDLFMSDDDGKTAYGRIEVKSALPGGLRFRDKITHNGLMKVDDGEALFNAYKEFADSQFGVAMDKDIFIRLCAYCIAKYMHGQFRDAKNYWLVIFDNKPHINKRGNIHGTETRRVRRVIKEDGSVEVIKESYDPNELPFGGEKYGMGPWLQDGGYDVEKEDVLFDTPGDNENGNEEIDVKEINGFLYIKRCKTINETMNRILSLIDSDSAIYKENKSSSKNNFTFYVDGEKIHIAHRDNPVLIKKKK